jgi:hypothetical protein
VGTITSDNRTLLWLLLLLLQVAWTRVCYEAAVEQSWPQQPLGVLSMGMVQGL